MCMDRYFDPCINFARNLKQLKFKFYVNFHVHKHKHTLGIMLNWDEESLAAEKISMTMTSLMIYG